MGWSKGVEFGVRGEDGGGGGGERNSYVHMEVLYLKVTFCLTIYFINPSWIIFSRSLGKLLVMMCSMQVSHTVLYISYLFLNLWEKDFGKYLLVRFLIYTYSNFKKIMAYNYNCSLLLFCHFLSKSMRYSLLKIPTEAFL